MRIARLVIISILFVALFAPVTVLADNTPSRYEIVISETLDLWRDGHYEQLFGQLAERGKTSREQFVRQMRDSTIRPACCWQKMEHFRLLNEKKNGATVYVKIGLEGLPGQSDTVTREFKLVNEHGALKMQLKDITSMAGVSKKKQKKKYRKSVYYP